MVNSPDFLEINHIPNNFSLSKHDLEQKISKLSQERNEKLKKGQMSEEEINAEYFAKIQEVREQYIHNIKGKNLENMYQILNQK